MSNLVHTLEHRSVSPQERKEMAQAAGECRDTAGVPGVVSLELSPGGAKLAAVLSNGLVQVLDRSSRGLTMLPSPDSDEAAMVTFSEDGRFLAQPDRDDGTATHKERIKVWNISTPGHALLVATIPGATSVAFGGTPARQMIATGGKSGAELFLLSTLGVAAPSLPVQSTSVESLAISLDGRFLAYADSEGVVHILLIPPDLDFSKKLKDEGPKGFDQRGFLRQIVSDWQMSSFTPATGRPRRITFSADSTMLATESESDTARSVEVSNLTDLEPTSNNTLPLLIRAGCNRYHAYIWRNADNPAPNIADLTLGSYARIVRLRLGRSKVGQSPLAQPFELRIGGGRSRSEARIVNTAPSSVGGQVSGCTAEADATTWAQ